MDALNLIGAIAATLGAVLAALNIREKLRPSRPHPLEPALRDLATAIREHTTLRFG